MKICRFYLQYNYYKKISQNNKINQSVSSSPTKFSVGGWLPYEDCDDGFLLSFTLSLGLSLEGFFGVLCADMTSPSLTESILR